MGLGDKWGHGAGTWGGFRGPAWWNETFTWGHGAETRGPAWWNETFKVTLGDTGLGHGEGLGDQHGGLH